MRKLPQIPTDAPKELFQYFKDHDTQMKAELGDRTPDNRGRSALLLISPDGSIWSVAVDNAGALAATKVHG